MPTNKKNTYRVNKKRFIPFILILFFCLFFLIMAGKNIYVATKCKNALYAIDYYITNCKDISLRLVKVESLSVVESTDGELIIDAYGISYSKPYLKINVLGTFKKDSNGRWEMTDINLKADDEEITNIN